jgi:hypothetical protein
MDERRACIQQVQIGLRKKGKAVVTVCSVDFGMKFTLVQTELGVHVVTETDIRFWNDWKSDFLRIIYGGTSDVIHEKFGLRVNICDDVMIKVR